MTSQTQDPAPAIEALTEPSQGVVDYLRRPLDIFRDYKKQDLSPDVVAGVTVAAVAIPQSIAYASIAELPPQYGLYAAVVAAIVGSLWGSSRHLATGPVNAVSMLVLPVLLGVAAVGTPDFLIAASTLALMVGVLNIALAVLRFGALVTLASRSVLIGFTAGAAIHIAVGQLKNLLQINEPTEPELYRQLAAVVTNIHQTHLLSLGLGVGTLVLLVVLRRLGPRVPAALVAISAAALVVAVFGLESHGVRVVGAIPRSLPPLTWTSLASLPDFDMIRKMGMGASPWPPSVSSRRSPRARRWPGAATTGSTATRSSSARASPTSPPVSFRATRAPARSPDRRSPNRSADAPP